MMRMYQLFKKLHMYAGLLNLSILLVFGIAGLRAAFDRGPAYAEKPQPSIEFRDFTVPSGLDDMEVAGRVYEFLGLPLTAPVPKFAVKRNAQNDLALDFYTPNGPRRAVVLEKENRIRLETNRNSLARFFDSLHQITFNARSTDWRIRYWTYYNEFSIWSLIGMSLSGVYLWLASRPRYRPAQLTFAAGCGLFVLLYVLSR